MADSVHLNVCPDCGEPDYSHMLDSPHFCRHEYERRVPVLYVPLDDVIEFLDSKAHAIFDCGRRWSELLQEEFGRTDAP